MIFFSDREDGRVGGSHARSEGRRRTAWNAVDGSSTQKNGQHAYPFHITATQRCRAVLIAGPFLTSESCTFLSYPLSTCIDLYMLRKAV